MPENLQLQRGNCKRLHRRKQAGMGDFWASPETLQSENVGKSDLEPGAGVGPVLIGLGEN